MNPWILRPFLVSISLYLRLNHRNARAVLWHDCIFLAQFIEHLHVKLQCLPKIFIFLVFHTIFLGCVLDDLRQRYIMSMVDFREQMMNDVDIDTSRNPASEFIRPTEICRSFQHMDKIVILNVPFIIRQRIASTIVHMCYLKQQSKTKAWQNMHIDPGQHDPIPRGTYQQQRQTERDKIIKGFGYK